MAIHGGLPPLQAPDPVEVGPIQHKIERDHIELIADVTLRLGDVAGHFALRMQSPDVNATPIGMRRESYASLRSEVEKILQSLESEIHRLVPTCTIQRRYHAAR